MTELDNQILNRFRFIFNCPKPEYLFKARPNMTAVLEEFFAKTQSTWNETQTFQYRGTLDEVEALGKAGTPLLPEEWFTKYKEDFISEVKEGLQMSGIDEFEFAGNMVDMTQSFFTPPMTSFGE